jgi:hypothetical protein
MCKNNGVTSGWLEETYREGFSSVVHWPELYVRNERKVSRHGVQPFINNLECSGITFNPLKPSDNYIYHLF